jgi:hypothetical protein
MDKSGHGKKQTEQGELTNLRPHSDRQVRTEKCDQARGTLFLGLNERGQEGTEGKEPSEGDCKPNDKSG